MRKRLISNVHFAPILLAPSWPFLWSFRRDLILHKKRLHEEYDLDHDSELLYSEVGEGEAMPENYPSREKSPNPMAVAYSKSQEDTFTFQMKAHSSIQKEEKSKEHSFDSEIFDPDIRCPQKLCELKKN